MGHSIDSAGLSPELVRRYQSAKQRFRDTTSALTSGTTTCTTTAGGTLPGPASASHSSNGLTRCTSEELFERLARLATTPRGPNSAPLETYRTTSTEHGEIYKATSEYVDWLRRQIPGYGVEGPISSPAAGRSFGGEGEVPMNL